MAAAFQIKLKGRLGHDEHDLKEMRVLNRIVRIVSDGLLYEPDPRHIELLTKSMGLEGANSQMTPGVKPKIHDEQEEEEKQIHRRRHSFSTIPCSTSPTTTTRTDTNTFHVRR